MPTPSPNNPYFAKPKTPSTGGDKKMKIFTIPQHYFKTAAEMEENLYKEEACIAMLPNTNDDFPFKFHSAFVFKDIDDRVYSVGLNQHNGIPMNPEGVRNVTKESIPKSETGEMRKKSRKKNKSKRKFKAKKSFKAYNGQS